MAHSASDPSHEGGRHPETRSAESHSAGEHPQAEMHHTGGRDYRKVITALLTVIVLIAVVFVLYVLYDVLLPLVLAALLSLLFKPIVHALRNRGVPLALCIIVVLLCVAGLIGLMYAIIASGIQNMVVQAPHYQQSLNRIFQSGMDFVESTMRRFGGSGAKSQLSDSFQLSSITKFLATGAGSVLTLAMNLVLTVLFLIFLLLGSEDFASKISRAFSTENSARVSEVLYQINREVRQYLMTKTLINLIVGAVTVVVLLLFNVDFAFFIGVLTFFLNYIPNFGSLLATVLPAIVSLLQYESLGLTLGLVAVLVVIHNIIGNLVEPKLMGSNLHLSPLAILLSLIFWGWVWGVWGMVLAIPVISMVKIVCENVKPLRPIAVLISSVPAKKRVKKE